MLESNFEMKTIACPQCYLCSSSGDFLYVNLKDQIYGAPGRWDIKKCTNPNCGLIWLDPMPLEQDIEKAYTHYYTHLGDSSSKGAVTHILRMIYYLATFISAATLGTRNEESSLNNMFLDNVKRGKLLEIGCGSGKFLYKMKAQGWEVEGIDFDLQAVQIANQKYEINAKAKKLEEMNYSSNLFDAITMNHVIEHVPDPAFIFQECYRILKKGGSLIVTTPNTDSWGHEKFGRCWRGLEPPRHLHLFSMKNLCECINRAEFKEIKAWTSTARAIGVLGASLDLKAAKSSEVVIPKKSNLGKAWFLSIYESFYSKFNKNIGEEIVLIAKK